MTFGDYSLSLRSHRDDLPKVFAQREGVIYRDGAQWPCVFATAVHCEHETLFECTLRYENAQLVHATLCIEPQQFRDLPGDAFYESVDARYSYHLAWLRAMGLPGSAYATVAWGVVGVGRGKSENVFIYWQAA
ncbi:hypothetical protein [Acidovorax sp. 106]|uniref:hypothetical protein n=1 Tax=Acidovorax sp. 106 TaxID=2135637 RepID=UPI0011C3530D|nr:hypothetical protein [Acidovorax sp. 106]